MLCVSIGLAFLAGPLCAAPLPDASLNLKLAAPISTWDEAMPLGNGLLGALVWGETNLVRVSLDRGDLWDERPSKRFMEVKDRFTWKAMQEMVASNRMAEFNDVFDANYDYNGPPTKLPAGRLEIELDPTQKIESFELNLSNAHGLVHLSDHQDISSKLRGIRAELRRSRPACALRATARFTSPFYRAEAFEGRSSL